MSVERKTLLASLRHDDSLGLLRLVVDIPEDASLDLRDALALRMRAEADRRCPTCGVPLALPSRRRRRAARRQGELVHASLPHDPTCPATTSNVEAMLLRDGWSLSVDLTKMRCSDVG